MSGSKATAGEHANPGRRFPARRSGDRPLGPGV